MAEHMAGSAADNLCAIAATEDVSFLVVGDPFRGSTLTHTDLFNRAKEQGVEVSSGGRRPRSIQLQPRGRFTCTVRSRDQILQTW